VVSASVVVCTRNRCDSLAACLASLDRQTLEGLEIVVVDNGSGDGTAAYLADWRGQGTSRVTLAEPVAGLSRARNCGLDAAGGDIVLFLDDDATAPVSWAAAHVTAYVDERVVAAGGPVVLRFPHGRPVWAVPELEQWWSALDHGDVPGPFPPPHGPYGTNMSVRRVTALEVGGFDTDLGRVGDSLLSSEEADLFERLWAMGGLIRYEPGAVVVHHVKRERLRVRWLLKRGWAQGRSNARRERQLSGRGLRSRCRIEAAEAFRGLSLVLRELRQGPRSFGLAVNELSRRAAHLAFAVEQLIRRARAVTGVGRRFAASRAE
jgi:glycosyltransferase involved in cell wall biosynthesis